MKYYETRLNLGGLMRCCFETISEYVDAHEDEECTDMVMDCIYEKDGNKQIKLENGIWKWNNPDK